MAPNNEDLDRAQELIELLDSFVSPDGKSYLQPPEGTKLKYPAIVIERNDAETTYADNVPWSFTQRYQITLIAHDPNDDAFTKIKKLPMCRFIRHFTTAGLNHDIFNLYF